MVYMPTDIELVTAGAIAIAAALAGIALYILVGMAMGNTGTVLRNVELPLVAVAVAACAYVFAVGLYIALDEIRERWW